MVLRKLVLSNLAVHRVRAALTIAAIALSVSLVVSVSTGYSSARGAAKKLMGNYMSTCDLQVTRSKGDPHGPFPESVVPQLASDPQAEAVLGRYETEGMPLDESGHRMPGHEVDVTGLRRPQDHYADNLQFEAGKWFDAPDGNYVVIDQVLAQRLKVGVGGFVRFGGPDEPLKLQVTGIVHKPNILAADQQEAYVPIETLERWLGKPGKINRVLITLKPHSDIETFKRKWEPVIQQTDPLLAMKSTGDMHQQLDQNMAGLQFLSYLGGTVSMLAAMFIVFSALSMGVGERQRTLAMLRAIGAYRAQLAKLVVAEGVILSMLGVAVGVPLGWFFVFCLSRWKSDFFVAGVVIDWGGVAYGVMGSVGAALLASLLPAWSATRVDPLEAMAPLAKPPGSRLPLIPTLAGLACIAIDPLLIFTDTARSVKFYGHFALGLPALMVGFFLLSPLFVWVVERVTSGVVARALAIQPALLRQQLSSGIWRAAGTVAALMVGLAILVVMQVEGHSMIAGWHLPNKFPDMFIYSGDGLTPAQQAKLATTPGIKPGELMPVALSYAIIANSNIDVSGANVIPTAAMFFGVDPDKALKMIELEFRDDDGNTAPASEQPRLNAEAAAMLKQGHHVIITDEYRRLLGKKRGDKITIQTQLRGNVDYTVAGVVWSPGMDVMVSMFDMERQFDQRTASSIFGSLEDSRRDFGTEDVRLFVANLDYGVDKNKLAQAMEHAAAENAATAPATQPGGGGGSLLSGAMKWIGLGPATTQSVAAAPAPADKASTFKDLKQFLGMSGIHVGDVRHIKFQITETFGKILLVLSTVAFASMAVAALGVTNTIMASIRSRRWQFGVLRSIGVTRGQLLRLVMAEAVLIALASCALGLVAGFWMSMDANGLSRFILGYVVPLAPPWPVIGVGVAIVFGTALLASLWPAASVATDEPLALLQAGRASA